MEYIKRETAVRLLTEDIDSDVKKKAYAAQIAASRLSAFPKEDVIDVVRCGECRCARQDDNNTFALCGIHGRAVLADLYCAWGKRNTER